MAGDHSERGARGEGGIPRRPFETGRRPVVLCILDGWGHREEREANAVALAPTPVYDRCLATLPHSLLRTDGPYVGLPEGQFGNSEVGHMNLGAGRIVLQDLPRVDRALDSGELVESGKIKAIAGRVRNGTGRLHLLGLVSPGGVHAHQRHMARLARLFAKEGLSILLHAFTDGRDTPPRAAVGYLRELQKEIEDAGDIAFATVSGRYYAMDRDRRFERTERAYRAIAFAEGPRFPTPIEAVEAAYEEGLGDEFVPPAVIGDYAGLVDGDGMLCVNFRADRVRQLLSALVLPDFRGFPRPKRPSFSYAGGMMSYSKELDPHLDVLVAQEELRRVLGEVLAEKGLTQFRIAETEKYAHVTYFFNGGRERPFPGEERLLVPSPRVATYDLKPEMSAEPVTDALLEAIRSRRFDFLLVNYANPDMVGHTGDLEAAIRAVATVDRCLGRLLAAVEEVDGVALVTADHGNCEIMRDPETGAPHTAHTHNPVPCILFGLGPKPRLRSGILADVAPTVLALLGLDQPSEMTGACLIEDVG